MSLQHIQKNSPRLLPKPAKFEKNPPNGYRVIRKTKCGAGGAGGAGSSPIHKQASLVGRLISKLNFYKLIPYPMDNLLNRSAQTSPPNVRKRRPVFPPAGRSAVLCTPQMAPRTSFLSRQPDVIASFSLSKPLRPLVS